MKSTMVVGTQQQARTRTNAASSNYSNKRLDAKKPSSVVQKHRNAYTHAKPNPVRSRVATSRQVQQPQVEPKKATMNEPRQDVNAHSPSMFGFNYASFLDPVNDDSNDATTATTQRTERRPTTQINKRKSGFSLLTAMTTQRSSSSTVEDADVQYTLSMD